MIMSSSDRLPSIPSSEQDATRKQSSTTRNEAVAGHSKTVKGNEIIPEDKIKQSSLLRKSDEDGKESEGNLQEGKKLGKRRRNSTKISNESKQAKRKASTDVHTCSSASYQPNTSASNARDSKTSETLNNDVVLARRMLDILMYPPSIHHQRSVLAVLKSDEKLQTVFNTERAKVANAKIPVFKKSSGNASTAGCKPSADEFKSYNQNHPVDTNSTLSFLMQRRKAQKIETAATPHYETNIIPQFPPLMVPSNFEASSGSSPSSLPSTECFIQQNLMGEEILPVTSPLDQQSSEPLMYPSPTHESNDDRLTYPVQHQSNVPTFEAALQDDFQPMLSEINTTNYAVNHIERKHGTALAENEHFCQSLMNSITSPNTSDDTDDCKTDDMMESFFALLEPANQT